MSPSAVSSTPKEDVQQASELVASAVASKLAEAKHAKDDNSPIRPLDASKLKVTITSEPRAVPAKNDPVVQASNYCTDHMVTAVWNSQTGWDDPELKPYGPFTLMPTASVLHYATECFEGLKVYRGFDGKLRLFRPNCNAERMLVSATRVGLPAFDPQQVEKLIIDLVAVDGERWLPKDRAGTFLYLRPAMIGSAPGLGVSAPKEATLFIIAVCFPIMDEIPGGISLLASKDDMVRAWPGGYGYAKVGGNYAGSLTAQAEASRRGYGQVLWLLGEDCKVTEAGASNFIVVWRTKEGKVQLVTAPLGDKIILDGVTRRSLLQLARTRFAQQHGELEAVEVVERWFTMSELLEVYQDGRLLEAFAAGTAWFVAPINGIHFRGKDINVPMPARYGAQLKTWLRDIMYGNEDHEWGVVIDEKPAIC